MRELVPTMVRVPPSSAAKPIGTRRLEMEIFSRFDIPVTTGRKRAAAPRFCISPDMSPTVTETVEMI